jgi:hypothetical protein
MQLRGCIYLDYIQVGHIGRILAYWDIMYYHSIISANHCKETQNDGIRGPFLTSTLAPRGKIGPLGLKFTPSFSPRGEHSLMFRRMEGQTEFHPPGDNFTPRGQNSLLGPTLPLEVKLRMGLRALFFK